MTGLEGLPLFAPPPRARRTDPATSHDAAARTDAPTLQARVLRVLRDHPAGLTTHELAEKMKESLVTISPRLAPLQRKGLVESAGKVCGRTRWRAVDHAA